MIQVERRVVNQLAAAHERELISPGCSLHLTVSYPKDKNGRNSEEVAPTIKLQLIKEGKKKVDIDVGNYFVPDDKLFFWRRESKRRTNRKRKWIWMGSQQWGFKTKWRSYGHGSVVVQRLTRWHKQNKLFSHTKNKILLERSWRACWLNCSSEPRDGYCVIEGRLTCVDTVLVKSISKM